VQGNLGLPVLSRFRVMVDFPHSSLYLVPEPGATDRPFDKDRAGLSTVSEEDGVRVTFFAPGSPAESAGLRVGDKISGIKALSPKAQSRGLEASDFGLADWRYGPAGTPIQLSLADHRRLTLVLRDYF
jgi:C-terminal processing protease CtpA/Prc